MGATNLLAYCRAGFERECAQEITALASEAGIDGFVKARPGSAFAVFHPHDAAAGKDFADRLDANALVFPRQAVRCAGLLADLPVGARAQPIVSEAAALGVCFRELFLETPDTNDGKALASLVRPFQPHLLRALHEAGIDTGSSAAAHRLHVFFVGGTACHVGLSRVGRSSAWPMGIARLRMPRGAPSRATLKLAEALLLFLGEEELAKRMRPGMTAVDLGAAPGGWTWQLVRRGLMVTAVDNAAMDAALVESGQVTHRREDGFHYRPRHAVDWLVCDMVESPARIAELAARWVARSWCREAVFNLKLPMKKRWEEVNRVRGIVADALSGADHCLRLKQLYHDREEVTAWLALRR